MRSVVIGTAGHIDHGKSALVRALTGTDPDRLKEERDRGITIDLGFAHLQSAGASLAFVDVPGHERFVKNMLAGVGGMDLVMLVVAADESVMPQTREHFEICRLIGVPAGIIVLTKIDIADPEMQEVAVLDVRELTAGSFLDDAPLVKVSSQTGQGIEALSAALAELSGTVRRRSVDRPVRLPVDRVFTVKGFGTVATGTLVAGRVEVDDELVILPAGHTVKARGLHVHGSTQPVAEAGQRVAVNLHGVERAELTRGDTLCAAGSIETTRRFDVALELLHGVRPLAHGTRVRFHHGTTELLGRVSLAARRGSIIPERELPAGEGAYARIRLEKPAVLTRGDRFIIRAYSPVMTIGGGTVLDPQPPRGPVRTEAGIRRLASLDIDSRNDLPIVAALVGERGAAGLPHSALVSRLGHSPDAAAIIVQRLQAAGEIISIDGALVKTTIVESLATALVAAITRHHAEHPLTDGLPREEARERVFSWAAPSLFEHVVERLVRGGRVIARDRLALMGHRIALTPEEEAGLETLEAAVRAAGLAPPDASEIARRAGIGLGVAERLEKLLVRRNRLIRLEGLTFHVEVLERLKSEVRELKAGGQARIDIAAVKARYGVSRKFAIPLLEYLDRERVTRRSGESRVIL